MNQKNKVVITHWIQSEVINYLTPYCDLILNQTRETLSLVDQVRRKIALESAKNIVQSLTEKMPQRSINQI